MTNVIDLASRRPQPVQATAPGSDPAAALSVAVRALRQRVARAEKALAAEEAALAHFEAAMDGLTFLQRTRHPAADFIGLWWGEVGRTCPFVGRPELVTEGWHREIRRAWTAVLSLMVQARSVRLLITADDLGAACGVTPAKAIRILAYRGSDAHTTLIDRGSGLLEIASVVALAATAQTK